MPGLTMCLTVRDVDGGSQFRDAQLQMLHSEDYVPAIDLSSPGLRIGHVAYPEYPIRFFNAGRYFIELEGRVYDDGPREIDDELRQLVDDIEARPAHQNEIVKSWMLSHDGEYIVLLANSDRKEIVLFNDPLGRLPVAYFSDNTQFIAAREDQFVARLSQADPDRLGWAQALWLGYPLGGRTLFEGVRRLPGGSMITCRAHFSALSMELSKLFEFDFDEQEADKPIGEFVSELHDQLIESARARGFSSDAVSVISLSGGQDSRAVAAALKAANAPCVAATFLTMNGCSGRDAQLAEQIAATLGIPWTLIPVPEATAAQEQRLVSMTGGHNLLSMAFILPFMDAIVERWGRHSTYVTGDGGDKIFPRVAPSQTMGNMDELIAHLVYQNALISSGQVERIFHLADGTLEAEMRSLLMSYPEQDLGHKYVHYIVYERGGKWLFEGEDRARFFLWETTPFYSFPLFQQAMRVPDALKSHNILYRKLQIRLSPEAACIPDQTYGLPASSWLFPWKVRLVGYGMKIPREIRKPIQRVLQHSRSTQPLIVSAVRIRDDSIMDADALREMLKLDAPSALQSWRTLDMLETMWRSSSNQKELQAS